MFVIWVASAFVFMLLTWPLSATLSRRVTHIRRRSSMGRRGPTPERAAAVEPDAGVWANTGRELDHGLLFLRSRRRDPCAERVAIELDRRRTPAELAAISADQADALAGVIHAVLDGIGLSGEQRERALAIAATELRRVAGEEP